MLSVKFLGVTLTKDVSLQSYQDVFVESLIDTVLSHFASCRPITTIVAAGLLLNLVHSPNKTSCLKPKHQEKLEVGYTHFNISMCNTTITNTTTTKTTGI